MALEVNIRKKLNGFTLDLEFQAGEGVFALLGESGCGKSMTLKCIAGVERPDEGRIVLDGKVLFDSGRRIDLPPQKRRIGYMFQDYALFPNMTVRRNVMAGMGSNPIRGKVDQILRRFRIDAIADQYPGTLSGGQKQRTAMARIIAQEPDVILLDEPFSALDSALRRELEQEMNEVLKDCDRPVIFVSHDRGEVFRLCSEVLCMREGQAETIGPVRDFFRSPGTGYAARLSGCSNVLPAERIDPHHALVSLGSSDPSCIGQEEWHRAAVRRGEAGVRGADTGWQQVSSGGETHVFSFRREIPADTAWIGIPAGVFRAEPDDLCDNKLTVWSAELIEDLTEWSFLCRTEEHAHPFEWRVPKALMPVCKIPSVLYLNSDDLLLLR